MGDRKAELGKLSIPQLRKQFNVPKTLRTKQEIINHILLDRPPESPKRIKIAPVFAMSKSAPVEIPDNPSCPLCEDTCTVWCELGLAVCPLCRVEVPTSPTVIFPIKQEPGVTYIPHRIDENHRVVLNVGPINKEALVALVTVHGFGLCESAEALAIHNTLQEAAETLLNKNRSSAENSSVVEAQLNSEQARDESTRSNLSKERSARSSVANDISIFTEIDSDFSAKHIFSDSSLLPWLLETETNPILLFDYLILRRDSVKWYKNHAALYFEASEVELACLSHEKFSDWFSEKMERLRNALYDLPETAGSIPHLFRSMLSCASNSDEVQIISCEPCETGYSSSPDLVSLD